MILELTRKGPRRGIRRPQGLILAERAARDRRDIERAAAVHARWLQSRATAGVPDLVHLQATAEADRAHVAEVRLLAELRAELEAERRHAESEGLIVSARARAWLLARAQERERESRPIPVIVRP